jgi:hypothetical protein
MVEKYLSGIDYPARKKDLVSKAKANNAGKDVIDTINSLPDQTFNSPIDVSKSMSAASQEATRTKSGESTQMTSGGRGLAAASQETREKVAHMGGKAPHAERGLAAASQETRERVAHMGGEASVSTETAVSAAEVQKFLKGMDYPAGKKEVVSQAKKNKAPIEVIDILQKMKDQKFNSAADVSKALGQVM